VRQAANRKQKNEASATAERIEYLTTAMIDRLDMITSLELALGRTSKALGRARTDEKILVERVRSLEEQNLRIAVLAKRAADTQKMALNTSKELVLAMQKNDELQQQRRDLQNERDTVARVAEEQAKELESTRRESNAALAVLKELQSERDSLVKISEEGKVELECSRRESSIALAEVSDAHAKILKTFEESAKQASESAEREREEAIAKLNTHACDIAEATSKLCARDKENAKLRESNRTLKMYVREIECKNEELIMTVGTQQCRIVDMESREKNCSDCAVLQEMVESLNEELLSQKDDLKATSVCCQELQACNTVYSQKLQKLEESCSSERSIMESRNSSSIEVISKLESKLARSKAELSLLKQRNDEQIERIEELELIAATSGSTLASDMVSNAAMQEYHAAERDATPAVQELQRSVDARLLEQAALRQELQGHLERVGAVEEDWVWLKEMISTQSGGITDAESRDITQCFEVASRAPLQIAACPKDKHDARFSRTAGMRIGAGVIALPWPVPPSRPVDCSVAAEPEQVGQSRLPSGEEPGGECALLKERVSTQSGGIADAEGRDMTQCFEVTSRQPLHVAACSEDKHDSQYNNSSAGTRIGAGVIVLPWPMPPSRPVDYRAVAEPEQAGQRRLANGEEHGEAFLSLQEHVPSQSRSMADAKVFDLMPCSGIVSHAPISIAGCSNYGCGPLCTRNARTHEAVQSLRAITANILFGSLEARARETLQRRADGNYSLPQHLRHYQNCQYISRETAQVGASSPPQRKLAQVSETATHGNESPLDGGIRKEFEELREYCGRLEIALQLFEGIRVGLMKRKPQCDGDPLRRTASLLQKSAVESGSLDLSSMTLPSRDDPILSSSHAKVVGDIVWHFKSVVEGTAELELFVQPETFIVTIQWQVVPPILLSGELEAHDDKSGEKEMQGAADGMMNPFPHCEAVWLSSETDGAECDDGLTRVKSSRYLASSATSRHSKDFENGGLEILDGVASQSSICVGKSPSSAWTNERHSPNIPEPDLDANPAKSTAEREPRSLSNVLALHRRVVAPVSIPGDGCGRDVAAKKQSCAAPGFDLRPLMREEAVQSRPKVQGTRCEDELVVVDSRGRYISSNDSCHREGADNSARVELVTRTSGAMTCLSNFLSSASSTNEHLSDAAQWSTKALPGNSCSTTMVPKQHLEVCKRRVWRLTYEQEQLACRVRTFQNEFRTGRQMIDKAQRERNAYRAQAEGLTRQVEVLTTELSRRCQEINAINKTLEWMRIAHLSHIEDVVDLETLLVLQLISSEMEKLKNSGDFQHARKAPKLSNHEVHCSALASDSAGRNIDDGTSPVTATNRAGGSDTFASRQPDLTRRRSRSRRGPDGGGTELSKAEEWEGGDDYTEIVF
jgi:hypothetical protein